MASIKDGTQILWATWKLQGLSPLAKQRVAQQLGQNMGFESHTVAPGTATNQAIANQPL